MKTVDKWTKDQILKSARYSDKKDVVSVVLKNNKQYTIKEVDGLIDEFMKGGN